MSSSIKSILSTVSTTAEAATAVVSVVNQYAIGWNQRSALAEQSRMLEAELEHKANQVALPKEAALELARRIQDVANKAEGLQYFNEAVESLK